MPRRASREAGFIVTLEMIIIFTILGIGLLAGIFAVRNALFVWLVKQQAQTVWVYDSNGIPLGPARDFDEHETPRLFYIDRNVADWGGENYRAMIGVRHDRFTSRQRIFYQNSTNCGASSLGGTVLACITRAGDEDTDNRGVGYVGFSTIDSNGDAASGIGNLALAGGVSYLYPLQSAELSGPTYAIGRDVGDNALPYAGGNGLPGTLYRQTPGSCDSTLVRSVWTSQTVISGQPCEALPAGVTVDAAKCPVGQDTTLGNPCSSPADPRCRSTGRCSTIPERACTTDVPCTTSLDACSDTGSPCSTDADCEGVCNNNFTTPCSGNSDCPPGAQCVGEQGTCDLNASGTCQLNPLQCRCPGTADDDPSNDWVDYGANCCPPGSIETSPGQCSIADDGSLREADPVELNGINVLSQLVAPFSVNLPPDPADFRVLSPTSVEGGGPGRDAGPYTGTDFMFDRAPNDSTELEEQ